MKKINFILCLFFFAGCNPDKPTNNSEDSLLIGEWIGGNPTKPVKTFTLTIRADKTYEAVYRANPKEYDAGTWSYDKTTQILALHE
ncbi:DUF3994 domain-containing protein [Runella sp.]|jgi:hypothetical protein|uniref:DUF3994 domain-containing protein n=1 Tax=Runella sp. TaxID=1960881 RepID=UPI0026201A13|nr:hypothetical protein [Runella sp.]